MSKYAEFARQLWDAASNSPLAEGDVPPAHAGDGAPNIPCCGPEFWMYVALCVGLVVFSAIMAGLTVALMSLDSMNIAIIEASGTDRERKFAKSISPILKNRHLLLVTLLIGNATAMESLPIFLDRLVSPSMAIVLSVTMVLIFGEIFPQAIFSHYRLPIGAYLSGLVWVLELVLSPVAWPIAKLLDWALGPDHPTVYRRAELKELTRRHLMTLDGQGTLSHDEVKIMSGVLDMANKEAKDAMLDVDRFFMLDCDATLDGECMQAIMASGHSRIPVYVGGRQNVVGILIVKNIILVDPNSQTKVRDVSKFAIRRIPRVSKRLPLFELLHFFGQGRSHLALVCDDEGAGAEGGRPTYQPLEWSPIVGVISMEDVIEELIQDEILDETDLSADVAANLATKFMTKNKRQKACANTTIGDGRPPRGERSPDATSQAELGGDKRSRLHHDMQQESGEAEAAVAWRTIALTSLLREKSSAALALAQASPAASGGGEATAPSRLTPLGRMAQMRGPARTGRQAAAGQQLSAPLLPESPEAPTQLDQAL